MRQLKLMSLHQAIYHGRIVTHLEVEEAVVRNAVGLISAPLVDNSVTVSIYLNGKILVFNDMLYIVNSGV